MLTGSREFRYLRTVLARAVPGSSQAEVQPLGVAGDGGNITPPAISTRPPGRGAHEARARAAFIDGPGVNVFVAGL